VGERVAWLCASALRAPTTRRRTRQRRDHERVAAVVAIVRHRRLALFDTYVRLPDRRARAGRVELDLDRVLVIHG